MADQSKQLRFTNAEIKEKLGLVEAEEIEAIDVWFDNIMMEWVLDATINSNLPVGGKG